MAVSCMRHSPVSRDVIPLLHRLDVILLLTLTSTVITSSADEMMTTSLDLLCPEFVSVAASNTLNTKDAGLVNVSFEPVDKLILFEDGDAVTLTVIIRRHKSIGKLCIYVDIVSTSAIGDPANPPALIRVDGVPRRLAEDEALNYTQEVDGVVELQFNVTLYGRRLGRGRVMVSAQEQQSTLSMLTAAPSPAFQVYGSGKYQVLVNRPPASQLAMIGLVVVACGMSINMLSFSCRLHTDIVRHHIRRPFGIIIGTVCQFVIMPVVGYLCGLAFGLHAHIRYAMLVLGCCPGGGPSNIITMLLHGDIHMSVIMTCSSNFLSIGLMPLWCSTLGAVLLRAALPTYEPRIPWIALVILGLLFSVPAFIGNIFRRCVSERTAIITSLAVRAVGIVLVISGAIIAFYTNAWIFKYLGANWQTIVAVTIFSHIGYIVSWLLAIASRRSPATMMTIAVESGFQSFPSMLFYLQLSCPQPESMLGYPVALIYMLNVVGAALIAWIYVICQDVRKWQSNEPQVIEVDRHASPQIADSYSMSDVAAAVERDIEKFKSSVGSNGKPTFYDAKPDSLGMRTGSFSSLPEKF